MSNQEELPALEMWGGIECTVNRVGDTYFTQLDRNGHLDRDDDLARFAALGLRALRYPVLWESTAPEGPQSADWSWADRRLHALRAHGIAPIVGLVHHGSGPRHTHLLDPQFATGLAEFAAAVAERFPWVEQWTPVNEPLTTARFSALYGLWYPHASDDRSFVTALLNQCRATVLAMEAIRRVNPAARLVQTDDLSRTYGTERVAGVVDFYNERRWLAWDLLCGRVDRHHPLWEYLLESGAGEDEILWFAENPCPPDVIGVNYYVTSERWLDHRVDRYPGRPRGGAPELPFVDIESVRVLATPAPAIASLLQETWQRYRIPIAVTEAHIDAGREDQLRWLHEIWRGAHAARDAGADVRAVTAWSLLGSFDWNCLLGECRGYYEPGPFDVRAAAAAADGARGDDRRARRRPRREPPGAARRRLVATRRPLRRPPRRAPFGGDDARRLSLAGAERESSPRSSSAARPARSAAPSPRSARGATWRSGCSTARRWTSPTRRRLPRPSLATGRGPSSTPAATCASTTPSATRSAACARTPSVRRCSPRRAPVPAFAC